MIGSEAKLPGMECPIQKKSPKGARTPGCSCSSQNILSNLAIVERIGFLPVHAKCVVNLEDRGDITTPHRFDQSRDHQPPAKLGHPEVRNAARANQFCQNYFFPGGMTQ